MASRRLSALLSQVLVAYTVEFDNAFERGMADRGHPGGSLSMVVWLNLMRFLAEGEATVADLRARGPARESGVELPLGCLERWRFVVLLAEGAGASEPGRRREGWGSGRGIRSSTVVRLTERGRAACEVWPGLFEAMERSWEARFGEEEIGGLRRTMAEILGQIDLELPWGVPPYLGGPVEFPARRTAPGKHPLPVLLSQSLLAFAVAFDGRARAPLVLSANTLRVLGEWPIPVGDLPRLTGGSPETSGIGWQMKPYVVVEADPSAKRGKVVRLSPLGMQAQQTYRKLTAEIEKAWEERFGRETVARLRELLEGLFEARRDGRLLLAEGLTPDEGTIRAGQQTPALGRQDVGAAARQRGRDLVAQTELFRGDPAGTLPHFPLWDMNRGFGP